MEHRTVQIIFLFVTFVVLSSSAPQQQFRKSLTDEDDTQLILGESILNTELKLQPSIKSEENIPANSAKKIILNSFKEPPTITGKSENTPAENEKLTDAVARSEFLKINKKANIKVPSNASLTVNATPIYITIPIYVNKAEGQPVQVSVGAQEIPFSSKAAAHISNEELLSPTSQYNRLLKQNSQETQQYKKPNRKSSGKNKRQQSIARKSSSRKRNGTSKQSHSYRFYF